MNISDQHFERTEIFICSNKHVKQNYHEIIKVNIAILNSSFRILLFVINANFSAEISFMII